ncbi:MAG TPA: MBOAT family O-acyltransferase [Leptospiraceae bacterium]|nr:MBOAT family O-acyltransferase [Leptospiraceae bacterium]HMZ35172.1 MBOAT family O-acyltransferase [Leptospiraceae bacterium]HNL69628.1 MBOAT family O-acyltransferase [Leptospiraceae bacterium]HNN75504.1 MBOAT family O-acyltransferase [Leptospiraceae bacterium]
MLFNSFDFLVFFFVFYAVYWQLQGEWRRRWLILSSMAFYAWWDFLYLFHFTAVVLISYYCYLRVREKHSKSWFYVGLALNIANLVFFKYVATTLQWLGGVTGLAAFSHAGEALHFGFPLAISFYTFQLIAILVDAWRGDIDEEIGFQNFLQYSFFFPHLIAGPILRHRDYFPQIGTERFDRTQSTAGIYLILFGLLKKVVIADGISSIIDPVYSNPAKFTTVGAVAALFGFALQIYADFSGYTDIARGLAKMLGYEIPENFRAPYFSYTFADLWRKWHITLSMWLRDYIFFPLGGSRTSPLRSHLNVLITMILAGLWHGHSYMFFFWGVYIGALMTIERLLGIGKREFSFPAKAALWVVMFTLWSSSALFFRGHDFTSAMAMIHTLSGDAAAGAVMPPNWTRFPGLVALSILVHVVQYQRERLAAPLLKYGRYLIPVIAVALFYMLVRLDRSTVQFIYFRF